MKLYTDDFLGFDVVFVPRSTWGSLTSTETFIRDRYSVGKSEKTNVQVHHTATIDSSDRTPNLWTYSAATNYVRSLQWARPDLGPLPYSENLAVSEDLETVWIFEGRGLLKVGAHTIGHNRDGIGIGVLGNLDVEGSSKVPKIIRSAIELRYRDLRRNAGYGRLGDLKSPNGWDVWGHRDSAAKSCPGNKLYPALADINITSEKGTNMKTYDQLISELSAAALPSWAIDVVADYVAAGGTTVPESMTRPAFRFDLAWFWNKFVRPLRSEVEAADRRLDDLENAELGIVRRIEALEARPAAGTLSAFDATITPK